MLSPLKQKLNHISHDLRFAVLRCTKHVILKRLFFFREYYKTKLQDPTIIGCGNVPASHIGIVCDSM